MEKLLSNRRPYYSMYAVQFTIALGVLTFSGVIEKKHLLFSHCDLSDG